ncbi:hypothetical protein HYH02_004016 [Chlamydomonas schloesseri]|uniref:RING-type domain-containing protein n=1 Tax=Chlamydomonas schloesseri TaxID=2026947 RepID=A0A836B939_9CHLO|nr:hypothetical protein HYH02_004016 [Chlamydomonas schloesseri]|eukprot:KAG2451417.1 hypothetical protein HYH02_004016 [Chlamydomonas schloesseri]
MDDIQAKAVARAAKHQEEVEAAQVRERARLAALRLEEDEQAAAAGRHGAPAAAATGAAAAGGPSGGGPAGALELEARDELEARFIANEVAEVRSKLLPPREGQQQQQQRERLRSATTDSVQVVIAASRVRSVLLKAFFPAGYPATPLALELEALAAPPPGSSNSSSSVRLSPVLVGKLQAALEAEVRKHAGGRQVLHAVHWLSDCLHANRLAAAYDEIQQLRAAAAATTAAATTPTSTSAIANNNNNNTSASASTSTGTSTSASGSVGCALELRGVKEKSGVVEVLLRAGGYHLDLRCVVPEAYPDAGVELHAAAGSNLPPDLLSASLAGAADLVRRLAEPPPPAVRVEVARAGAGTGRSSNAGSGSSSAASSASATPQRRRGGGGQQTVHSEAKAAALAAAAQEGAAAREAARAAAAAAHEPRPSLWAAVSYLGSRCVGLLCEGRCVACGKRLLPSDPAKQDQVPPGMHLLRLVTCGHFFHHKCIEGFLAEPPFGRDGCPVPGCGERVSHHKLVTEPQVLEARWAGRQARRREIEDAASILGL